MSEVPMPIKILVGAVTLEAELKPTRTAKAIYDLLPIEAVLNTWGEEFIFRFRLLKTIGRRRHLTSSSAIIAYWAIGKPFAFFFAPPPVTRGRIRFPPAGSSLA